MPLRDGDVVDVQGAAELTVRAPGAATPTLHVAAPWRARGTVQRGLATADLSRNGLAYRDPARDRDGAASEDPDAKLLSQLSPGLLGTLTINEDSKLANFGKTSVVQQTLQDGSGRPMQLYAVSELARGPMTDVLLVRDGKVLGYQQVRWVRDHGVWRAASARVMAKGRDGSTTTATVKVAGLLAAAEGDTTSWASLGKRVEEIQFAALAKRALLPASATAQNAVPGIDCSVYQNRFSPTDSPCLAYALNKAAVPLAAFGSLLGTAARQFSPEALSALAASRGLGAVIALLEGAGEAVIATAGSTWVALAASAMLIYTMSALVECRASHQGLIALCVTGQGGGGPTSGSSATQNPNTGCDALCDVQVRDMVNQIRAAMADEA
jgi:hypothetical protein